MTADQLAACVEHLIAAAREAGLSDEAITGVLHDAAEALQERLSCPPDPQKHQNPSEPSAKNASGNAIQ